MSSKQEEPSGHASTDGQGRRTFLTRSSLILLALGAAPLVGNEAVEAADKLEARDVTALRAVLDEAIRTGDIRKPLAERGAQLPNDVRATLGKLTKRDLEQLRGIRTKLKDLEAKVADNNGVVIM